MSDLVSGLYKELLLELSKWSTAELAGFAAQKGNKYNRELMVVGRAPNGWRKIGKPCDWQKGDKIPCILGQIFDANQGCPLAWVTKQWGVNESGYNTKKSAFWRVIHRVFEGLLGHSNDWPSHLVWTNLYKISPNIGGNPTGELLNLQHDICIKILKAEIELYQPKRVLFLTGSDWAKDFLSALEFKSDCKERTSSGTIFNGAKVVIMPHPQGKPEEKFVEDVLTSF